VREAKPTKPKERSLVRPLVLLAVVGVGAGILLWSKAGDAGGLGLSLPTAVQDFVTLTLSIMVEATPFVILGALVSAAIRLYVPTQRIIAFLPQRPAFRRLWISFLGMFMPVCECGNVPVARGLIFKGLSVPDSTTFLLAAPIINPVTLFATSQAFRLDPSIVWLRLAGALLIANLIGALISLHKNPISLLGKSFQETLQAQDSHGEHHHDHHHGPRWQEGIGIFRDEVSLMLKVLCLGAVIAGLTQVFVPRDVLTSLGAHPVYSILAMLALAFVVSICSNVDAFFALAYASTFTTGSIVAFLVFGPMVDIKMLAMMRTTYNTQLLAALTAIVALCSIFIGLVVNFAL